MEFDAFNSETSLSEKDEMIINNLNNEIKKLRKICRENELKLMETFQRKNKSKNEDFIKKDQKISELFIENSELRVKIAELNEKNKEKSKIPFKKYS